MVDCVVWGEEPSLTYAYFGGEPHAVSSAVVPNAISKVLISLGVALEGPSLGMSLRGYLINA